MNKKWIFIFLPLFMVACSLLGTSPAEPATPANAPAVEEEATTPAHEEPLAHRSQVKEFSISSRMYFVL